MTLRARDPLLSFARLALGLTTAASAVVALGLALLIPIVFGIRDKVLTFLVSNGAPPDAIWGLLGLQLLMATGALLGFFFFRHLYRIVDSVGSGDSFTTQNADRLAAMAWIAIAVHLLAIPLAILSGWLTRYSDRFAVDPGVSFAGLLLALVLFVLARVFREGHRMKEDLEGTV